MGKTRTLSVALAWSGEIHVWDQDGMPLAENLIRVTIINSGPGDDFHVISAEDAIPLRELLGVASVKTVPARYDADLEPTLQTAYEAVTRLLDIRYDEGNEHAVQQLAVLAQRVRRQIEKVRADGLDDDEPEGIAP